MKALVSFRIEPEIWEMFRKKFKHVGISSKLRELILRELNGTSNEVFVKKLDWKSLLNTIFDSDSPIQIIGDVGIGKSLTMKELIENDHSHVYLVFDAHNEYDFLPEVQMISTEISKSSRIVLPKQVNASIGLFPLYANQILSQKWKDEIVFVIEEAHRYPQTKLLLKEGRKFAKVVAITQEPLGSFCKIIRIIP